MSYTPPSTSRSRLVFAWFVVFRGFLGLAAFLVGGPLYTRFPPNDDLSLGRREREGEGSRMTAVRERFRSAAPLLCAGGFC